MDPTSVAESTARSSSAAVDRAWNWRPSSAAIVLKEAASSSNSSRLATETRLAKSRCAIRRVPSRSSTRGTRLRRIWLPVSRTTTRPVSRTTHTNIRENRTTGPSTSSSVSLSTSIQVGAANTSSSRIGQEEATNARPRATGGEGVSWFGAASVIGSD
jgi:hypothetical protein